MADPIYRSYSYEEAMVATQEDVAYLVRTVGANPPQLQAGTIKKELTLAIQRMAGDESSLSPGDLLSRIMRLPPVWRNVALEYIGGGGPYAGSAPNLKVTLLNVGKAQVRYLLGMTPVPIPDRMTGAPTDRQNIVKHFRNVAPGETVTLGNAMAVAALGTFGLYAQPIHVWANAMPRIDDRPLVEVAYEMEWFSEAGVGRASSLEWQTEKVASLVAAAERAGSQSEQIAVLEAVKPWWPQSEAIVSLRSRIGGEEPRRRRAAGV